MPLPLVSVIIPNYNGKELLSQLLPSLKVEKLIKEIIVVDDGSNDGSPDFILKYFPKIRLISLDKNTGFAPACMEGAKISSSDYYLFLNNDIQIYSPFLEPMVELAEKERDTFSVVPQIINASNHLFNEALIKMFFSLGFFYQKPLLLNSYSVALPLPYGCGAAVLVKKDKFWQLNGFDTMFAPFYWEDFDLGFRGWLSGWQTIYQPESKVIHLHSTTINRTYTKTKIEIIFRRNQFLFHWKNITSKRLLAEHLLFLFLKLIKYSLTFNSCAINAFFQARKLLPIIKERRKNRRNKKLKDLDVIKLYAEISKKN